MRAAGPPAARAGADGPASTGASPDAAATVHPVYVQLGRERGGGEVRGSAAAATAACGAAISRSSCRPPSPTSLPSSSASLQPNRVQLGRHQIRPGKIVKPPDERHRCKPLLYVRLLVLTSVKIDSLK